MNLYLISQDSNKEFDTFDSAVVAAETEDEARQIVPRFAFEYLEPDAARLGYHKASQGGCADWTTPENVRVVYIGTARDDIPAGVVICASYNAG